MSIFFSFFFFEDTLLFLFLPLVSTRKRKINSICQFPEEIPHFLHPPTPGTYSYDYNGLSNSAPSFSLSVSELLQGVSCVPATIRVKKMLRYISCLKFNVYTFCLGHQLKSTMRSVVLEICGMVLEILERTSTA